jgi:hypothetical protein
MITNHDGSITKYIVKNKLLIEKLAVNIDYPIKIYVNRTGRVRYQDKIIPSKYGPVILKIKSGFNFAFKWPPPSRKK